jgi:predicted AAA+ superfamily ATPase
MDRYYLPYFQKYLSRKIVLISGPRQSGKTTITRMFDGSHQYLNLDSSEDQKVVRKKAWDRSVDFVVFDELHKMKKWKQWIKGVYDTEGLKPSLVVTGSARLDTFKKVGDSLAGRYLSYRLHPFDIRELRNVGYPLDDQDLLNRLLELGGFPEPFLEGDKGFYNMWKRTHLDIILRQDLIDQEDVRDIRSIEILIDLLRERVGSPVSYKSLAEDLQKSDKTIKKWLDILEGMFIIFKLTPYHKNIARSKLKQPKYYFYDTAQVKGDNGARLENLVACSLLKETQFRCDCLGEQWGLFYLAMRSGKEIDFLITKEDLPHVAVEVKTSDDEPSKNFRSFENYLTTAKKIQVVQHLNREKTYPNGIEVRSLVPWLCSW